MPAAQPPPRVRFIVLTNPRLNRVSGGTCRSSARRLYRPRGVSRAHYIPLVLRDGNGSKDGNDRHDNHEFDQGEASLPTSREGIGVHGISKLAVYAS